MSLPIRIVCFNGPPSSGKDLCAAILRRVWRFETFRFSDPLKAAIPAFLGTTARMLEPTKDDPIEWLPGRPTYRDLQISLSETWAKPYFGNTIFGALLAQRIAARAAAHPRQSLRLAVPDSGFFGELQALHDGLADERAKILLVRLERPGTDFSKDSRRYLDFADVQRLDRVSCATLINAQSIQNLQMDLVALVKQWEADTQ